MGSSLSMRIEKDVLIEMRDGVRLEANIYRPDDGNKHPAILVRSYDKGYMQQPRMLGIVHDFINSGYALISQTSRGRGASEGEWRPQDTFKIEGPDGFDSVEWIASQSWCDGNVGMTGASHMTCRQWLTAVENPRNLKAITPWTGDFESHYAPARTGGVISLFMALSYASGQIDVINRLEKEGKNVSEMRSVFTWAQNNPEESMNFLPLKDFPPARFEQMRNAFNWRLHPLTQPELEKLRQYEKVTVPCFHEFGWYDPCGWTVYENFKGMQKRGGSQISRQGQYLIMGPWQHGMAFQNVLGDINFGVLASSEGSMVNHHLIDFYDKYLKGKDIILPAVRYFVMGLNQWRNADDWPLPQTQWQRFYLHSKGIANTASGNGILSRDEPGSEPPDRFIYDPHNPVPTVGGAIIGAIAGAGGVTGPLDQCRIEKREDVLCYTTPALRENTEVTGPLQVHLFAATSTKDTDFTAKLIDVYPDGRAYNIGEGIIRASGRKLSEKPELINPGEVYEYVITVGQTSQLFREGHRIRVDISSSNFPQFDRNMNTGNPIGEDAKGIPAMQTIYHDNEYASYIDLPVIPK